MATTPLQQLTTVLQGCLLGADHTRALRLLVTNLPRSNGNYMLRRYVADVLVALEKNKSAAELYEVLVRHFTNSGQPLAAIAVAKRLEELEPRIGAHLDHIASVYATSSPFLDLDLALGAEPPPDDAQYDLNGNLPDLPLDALAGVAHEIALRKDNFASSPDSVPPIPLLSHLDVGALREILDRLSINILGADDIVWDEGEAPEDSLWIVSGEVEITRPTGTTERVSRGALLGYTALRGGTPEVSAYSVRALADTEVLRLDADAAQDMQEHDVLRASLEDMDLATKVTAAMAHCHLLGGLSEADRSAILTMVDARRVKAGDTLIPKGSTTCGVYIVVEGTAKSGNRSIGTGQVIGETNIMSHAPTADSTTADTDMHVLYLNRMRFAATCRKFPSIMAASLEK